ncbi:MAG: 50S ribosomal protein L24 [Elusimicrobiota bacterium]|nr:50S ribosomal protein L24 [Elusimicrobiota bacterium]
MKLKIRKKDKVVVISGKDKGKVGEVIEILAGGPFKPARVLVSKVNVVTKHKKPTQTEPGGISKMEAPIALSNVMLVDPKTNKPTRVRIKVQPNGDKVRVAVGSGATIE